MANPVIYKWDEQKIDAICAEQNVVDNGFLILDGTLAPSQNNPITQISLGNVSRSISVTATYDAGNVTISGTLLGNKITETIVVDDDTVETNTFFDTVTSVEVENSSGDEAISVGTGTTGRTQWFLFNYHCAFPSLTVDVSITDNINYTLQTTLDDISYENYNNGVTNPQPDNAQAFHKFMDGVTSGSIVNINYPIHYASILINSSDDDGSLTAIFLQQGIN